MTEVMVTGASIPKSIAEAVLKTQADLGTLTKDDTNPFANFSYVSIDKYYEIVAAAATKNKLSWFCQEVLADVVLMKVKDGENVNACRFSYLFTMFHGDGNVVPVYDKITIFHPLQGAQTSGAAASYAEKLFMRKAFKVVTGEGGDADASPGFDDDLPDAPAPAPAPVAADLPDDTLAQPEPEETVEDIPDTGTENSEPDPQTSETRDPTIPDDPPHDAATGEVIDLKDWYEERVGAPPLFNEIKAPNEAPWEIIFEVFQTFLPDCNTFELTKEFWVTNTKAIEYMKDHSPEHHVTLVKMFKEHQTKLQEEAKK
jgi:hypothetical protein